MLEDSPFIVFGLTFNNVEEIELIKIFCYGH